jgi:hypothetical protein
MTSTLITCGCCRLPPRRGTSCGQLAGLKIGPARDDYTDDELQGVYFEHRDRLVAECACPGS